MLRILFDQNVPRALSKLLPGHTITTASELGWQEPQNGELLKAAAKAGFEILLSRDQNVVHQQNMRAREIGLIVLSTSHWPTLRDTAAVIADAVNQLEPNGYSRVECEITPRRKRTPP